MIEATPAYRVLTSRPSLFGADGLDGINTNPLNQGAMILVGGSIYRLDRNSVDPPDGLTVIQPSAGPGRWLFVASASASINVANLSALGVLGASSPDVVWVLTTRCLWHRNAASTLAPDGITVVAAVGGGNWERMVPTTAPDWLVQAAWSVDPLTGNDENAGTAVAPLATFAELDRRLSIGAIQQDTTVTVPAGASVAAGASLDVDRGDHVFSIVGTPTTVATGTVFTYTDRTHAGGAPEAGLLTDLGVADWTPYVGMRIRITSGAAVDAISFIAAANPNGAGLNVARVVRFGGIPSSIGGVTAVSPAPGSTYVIESLPVLSGVSFRERKQLAVNPAASRAFFLSSVDIHSGTTGLLNIEVSPYSRIVVDGCWLDCQMSFGGFGGYAGRVVCRTRLGGPNLTNVNFKGGALLRFILVRATGFMAPLLECSWEVDTAVFQGGTTGLLIAGVAGALLSTLFLRDSQFFDCGTGINLQNTGTIFCGSGLSGTGNGIGLSVGDAASLAQVGQVFSWAQASDLPNLLGTTTPIRVCGTTGSNIDLTWAQVPFSSDRQNGVGTLTNGTATITARHANTLGVKLSKATPSGNPQGTLTAPTASRSATQFVVNAADAAGALVNTDQSTFDWEVPGFSRPVTICQANAIQRPI